MDVSPVGCFYMAGNVEEWVEDRRNDSYEGAPTDGSAWGPVYRSASLRSHGNLGAWEGFLRTTWRTDWRRETADMRGFRCAWNPTEATASPDE